MYLFALSLLFLLFFTYRLVEKKEFGSLLPLFYMFIIFYSYLGSYIFTFARDVPFDLYFDVSKEYYNKATLYFFISALSFYFGSFFSVKIKCNDFYSNSKERTTQTFLPNYVCFLLVLITLISFHFGLGFQAVYQRVGYNVSEGGVAFFRVVFMFLLPISSFLLAFGKTRLYRILMLIVLIVIVQGSSSRSMLMIPVFYFLGTYFRDLKFSFIKAVVCTFLVVVMVGLSMSFRDNQLQGVIPNIKSIFDGQVTARSFYFGLNYMFSYSLYAFAFTLQNFNFDLKAFLIAINPLPGALLDINYMVKNTSLNTYSPFPAIAVIAQGGGAMIVFLYSLFGFVFATLESYFKSKFNSGVVVTVVMFISFTMLSAQYNLRGTMRFFYYSILIALSIKVFFIIKYNLMKYKGKING